MTLPADLPDWQTKFSPPTDDLIDQIQLGVGATSAQYTSSQFNSIQVSSPFTILGHQQLLTIIWIDANNHAVDVDTITAPSDAGGVVFPGILVPVRAPNFQLFNGGTVTENITIIGTQRVTSGLVGVGYADVQQFNIASAALVAGNYYPFTPLYAVIQGLAWLSASIQGTVVKGLVEYDTIDAGGNNATGYLIGSDTMAAVGASQYGQRQVILPASMTRIGFRCEVSGTASVNMQLASLGH